jgi:apolipoprotein N-acyltransferase
MENRFKLPLLAVSGGLLMTLAWPMMPMAPLMFFAFSLPLVVMEADLRRPATQRKRWKSFFYIYLFLLVWNVGTTWWISNVHLIAGIFANLANALLMAIPLLLTRYVYLRAGRFLGYIAFICLWLSFEYLHLNWELTWAWLTLGNGFAFFPQWIQWYEWTGPLGGSFWVLVCAAFFTHFILIPVLFEKKRPPTAAYVYMILLMLFPIMYSWYLFHQYEEKGEKIEVIVVQPNIDPFNEKFEGSDRYIPKVEQVERMKSLSDSLISPSTRWVLWPETSFDTEQSLWEEEIERIPEVEELRQWVASKDNLELITGATTFRSYGNDRDQSPPTARHHPSVGYYDVYNSSFHIKAGHPVNIYHKSKLVPGVERMPYPAFFRFLEALVLNLGGASGSMGTQPDREVYCHEQGHCTTPCICYESIFPEFMSEASRKGAGFISIITNDGWWGNSPGHRQHAAYASLLAISLRRDIARAANTGISCFVDQRGLIRGQTSYWVPAVVKDQVRLNDRLTYYAEHGDYLGKLAAFLGVLLFLSVWVKHFTRLRSIDH